MNPNRIIRSLTVYTFLFAAVFYTDTGYADSPYKESALVHVNVTTELQYPDEALVVPGRLLDEYKPKVILEFSSTGVVLGDGDKIMMFLGYGRIFVNREDSRFEISTPENDKYSGELIGIDHVNGAAVIQVPNGKLKKTAICDDCTLHEGSAFIAPIPGGAGETRFQATQVFSINSGVQVQEKAEWVLRTNHPFLDVGQPIFTKDHLVLGFIVSQDQSRVQNVVYRISELLSSAWKILENKEDIHNGWLGVKLKNISTPLGNSVRILGVAKDSPAQKAGLASSDIVVKYNGEKIENAIDFINRIKDTTVGSNAELEILRRGKSVQLQATVEELKYQNPLENMRLNLPKSFGMANLMPGPGPTGITPPARIGFNTIALNPAWVNFLKIPRSEGLLVIDIMKQSPAYRAGIKNRDVILSVNEQPVSDAQKFNSYLQTLPSGSTVSMKVIREGSEQTISFQLPD